MFVPDTIWRSCWFVWSSLTRPRNYWRCSWTRNRKVSHSLHSVYKSNHMYIFRWSSCSGCERLGDEREDYQNCSVLCCVRQLCTMICAHLSAVLTVNRLFQLRFSLVCFLYVFSVYLLTMSLHLCVVCCCFITFSFFSTRQQIGWEDCLQNDLFCVRWVIKPIINNL